MPRATSKSKSKSSTSKATPRRRPGRTPKRPAAAAPKSAARALFVLQRKGQPGVYHTDTGRFPLRKPQTSLIAEAMTWNNKSGPHKFLERRPELGEEFEPAQLQITSKPAGNGTPAPRRGGGSAAGDAQESQPAAAAE